MAYVTRAEIETAVPSAHLIEALDDNADGSEDTGLFTSLVTQVSTQVDAYLAGLYPTPFADPAPASVREAAFVFLCELLYLRRSTPLDQNPFTRRADVWRERLDAIGKGTIPLDVTQTKTNTPGAVVTDTASIDDDTA